MKDVLRELRYAVRSLRKSPGFAAAAIGTLALGIAATSVVFSILHAVVLAPLPYREPATDPVSLAAAALALVIVTLLASGLPARRAARIAPTEALKGE